MARGKSKGLQSHDFRNYADTFRRKFIDTAGRMVFHRDKLVMKVSAVDFVRLRFDQLFVRLQVGLPQLC